MKVKKKWKEYVHQIALACLLICCIVTCVPQTTKADTKKKKISIVPSTTMVKPSDEDMDDKHQPLPFLLSQSSSPVYCFAVTNGSGSPEWYFISKEKFSIDYYSTNGEASNKPRESFLCSKDGVYGNGYGDFYYLSFGNFGIVDSIFYSDFDGFYYDLDLRAVTDDLVEGKRVAKLLMVFAKFLYTDEWTNGGMDFIGDDHANGSDDAEGGIDNPIFDSDIGCPIITRKITRDLSGVDSGNSGAGGSLHVGETQVGDNIYYDNGGLENGGNGFYTSFTWKNSTTTGFSLNKNKYAQTFLQVRIQNRSVIYSNLKHTKVKRKLDSYGENSLVYDSWAVSKKPLYFNLSSESFLKKYLPKYYEEINSPVNLTNALFLGNKYAFQFRIICTDDLSVIPGSGGNSKWHCGRWTEVTVNCDVLEDDDPYQKTGDIDSNGDFVQKEDDTTTKIDDSSSGQADNMDDFKDSAENGTKKGLDTSGFGWDDFKNLINECKQVPGLIKSVFSFLPDWVLVFITIGFGIWIFVLIKRAIV